MSQAGAAVHGDAPDPRELIARLRACGLGEIAAEMTAILALHSPPITLPPLSAHLTGGKLRALNSYLKAAAYGERMKTAADLTMLDLIIALVTDDWHDRDAPPAGHAGRGHLT